MTAERHLEEEFIQKLAELKYTERPDIRDRTKLEANFREKFNELNQVTLTDSEFNRLKEEIVSADTFEAARRLREKNLIYRDDGTPLEFTLINLTDWCRNSFEVVSQLRMSTDYGSHRYDVILLLNGIPVAQVELKTLGINPRRAMEQIVHYKNDPGNGYTKSLLCFIQLFIVSNRDKTFYFANNNERHFAFDADERYLPIYKFADPDNRKIDRLDEFAEKFLSKCTLAQTLARYMVLVQSEKKLMVMRPYQIYAVKAIVQCIEQSSGNGYIWHTTGSGKTLTSFKASTLLKENRDIHKCLFVVDRKDLDKQTREEFNRFQEGCVEPNTNTEMLVRRLLSTDIADKVIVTTIQKLGLALDESSKRNKQKKRDGKPTFFDRLGELSDKRMVIIFDECHRSQFGEYHSNIKAFFPKAQLFGFTGTPIFEKNSDTHVITGENKSKVTTEDVFEKELHAYTITHAIDDQNVLSFHVDYYEPELQEEREKTPPPTKRAIVSSILDKHHATTAGRRFNALFATARINDAIEYVSLFNAEQQQRAEADPGYKPLRIACVFSPPADAFEGASQFQQDADQEREDWKEGVATKKSALKKIIDDYNTAFGTGHRIEDFDTYYQDIQKRIKDQQWPNRDWSQDKKIDITIVVDMLLTGFDSKYLNTLYVDKNLKQHGLIQAFSRTNRILNATKPFGAIHDYRGLRVAVDEAITRFSGVSDGEARKIWLVDPAPVVIEKLKKAVAKLEMFMGAHDLEAKPEDVANLKGDAAKVGFIDKFKAVQRLAIELEQYTDLKPEHKEMIEAIMPEDRMRGLRGAYLSTAQEIRDKQAKPLASMDPAVQEADVELVVFASAHIDYDYIMQLIANFSQQTPGKQKMTREQLIALVESYSNFQDDRELLKDYILSLQEGEGLELKAILANYERFKNVQLEQEVAEVAEQHGLKFETVQEWVTTVLKRKSLDVEGLRAVLDPLGLGWRERNAKELALMDDLEPLLRRRAGHREIAGLKVYELKAEYNADER